MKVEVKQILSDISYFSETIRGIRFMRDNNSWLANFPSIVNWSSGEIVLELLHEYECKEVAKRLSNYGIKSEIINLYQGRNDGVKFTATVGDDIINILHKALTDSKQRKKTSELSWQLSGLNQNVDMLIQQLPFVNRGAFSRGVKAFKNQVEALKNIRASHTKQH